MSTTVSKVRHYSNCQTIEEVLLQKWCELAASKGGSFSIEHPNQVDHNGYYQAIYTINWPEGVSYEHQ